jgi:MYXO-CTERM domain-containing protein
MWLLSVTPALADVAFEPAICAPAGLTATVPSDGAQGLPAETVVTLVFGDSCGAGVPAFRAELLREGQAVPFQLGDSSADAVSLVPEEPLVDGVYEVLVWDAVELQRRSTFEVEQAAEHPQPTLALEATYNLDCGSNFEAAEIMSDLLIAPPTDAVVRRWVEVAGEPWSAETTLAIAPLDLLVETFDLAPVGGPEACLVVELDDVTGTVVDQARACFQPETCPALRLPFSCDSTSTSGGLPLALGALVLLRRRRQP